MHFSLLEWEKEDVRLQSKLNISRCNCVDMSFVEGGALKPGFGFPAFSGIARLTWLVDLFGRLSVTAATIEEDSENSYCKMTAQLLTSATR